MFLVTGASGELFGRPVLDHLRRLSPEADIVAGTRDPGSPPGSSRPASRCAASISTTRAR